MQTRKLGLSLRVYVSLSLLFLILSMVALYSVVTVQYFIQGLDTITRQNMIDIAKSVQLDENGQATVLNYHINKDWATVPQAIQDHILDPPSKNFEFKKRIIQPNIFFKPTEAYFVAQAITADGEVAYISRHSGPKTFEDITFTRKPNPVSGALVTAITVLIIFSTVLLLILRSVANPIEALRDWAKNLSPQGLEQAPPTFRYSELNTLADLIRGSLLSVQQSLEREQKFLRHASHELRTPIATISSNIELLKKIHPDPAANEQRIVDRIDRASATMRHLTETLLWLSREDGSSLAKQEVKLDELLAICSGELHYLLQDKQVTVELDTESTLVNIPLTPSKILLDNLIRNAFQHTHIGGVRIHQRGSLVRIDNWETDTTNRSIQDLGFGLGLDLSKKLAERFKWQYRNESNKQGHTAEIKFG